MVIYEISAKVEDGQIEAFELYMRDRHMPDLIRTGFFESAEMANISAGEYKMQYHCLNKERLDEYLNKEAERLRKDFLLHFPEGVKVTRKIIE